MLLFSHEKTISSAHVIFYLNDELEPLQNACWFWEVSKTRVIWRMMMTMIASNLAISFQSYYYCRRSVLILIFIKALLFVGVPRLTYLTILDPCFFKCEYCRTNFFRLVEVVGPCILVLIMLTLEGNLFH